MRPKHLKVQTKYGSSQSLRTSVDLPLSTVRQASQEHCDSMLDDPLKTVNRLFLQRYLPYIPAKHSTAPMSKA